MTGTGSSLATCLGCGCACDDIALTLDGGRIAGAANACQLGVAWFGDGRIPARVRVAGADASLADAIAAAAQVLARASRPLVYLAPDLSCEAQREAIGLADAVRALADSVTSATAAGSLLAAQELGRATATLGEVRHRADLLVFWGVDPDASYPRFRTRYAPEPPGVHVPDGRRSRTVIAVDVGASRGPSDADHRVALSPGDEVSALTLLRAASLGRPLTAVADGDPGAGRRMQVWHAVAPVLEAVRGARYVAVVADAEPDTATPDRDPGRASALIGWTQALHETTRAALMTLRAGGNRSGADAWLTAQTGYPMGVDFSRGYPQYRPHDAATARLDRGEIDAAVVTGAAGYLPGDTLGPLHRIPVIVIGPRASEGPLGAAHVVIDTGIAGIHEGGTALRMDDVPLPIMAALAGAPAAAAVLRDLRARVGSPSE